MSVYDLLGLLDDVMERAGIPYFITGSVASFEYGRVRTTNDVDVVVQLNTDADVEQLLAAFPPNRFLVDEHTIRNAVASRSMFSIIDPITSLKIDFMLPQDSYDRRRFERASRRVSGNGITARFASPEDVILKKLLYFKDGGSDKHLTDIAAMIRISREQLDFDYLDRWADILNVLALWRDVRARAER